MSAARTCSTVRIIWSLIKGHASKKKLRNTGLENLLLHPHLLVRICFFDFSTYSFYIYNDSWLLCDSPVLNCFRQILVLPPFYVRGRVPVFIILRMPKLYSFLFSCRLLPTNTISAADNPALNSLL